MGAGRRMSMQQFRDDANRQSGGRRNMLKSWKKNTVQDPKKGELASIVLWLNSVAGIVKLWQHRGWKLATRKDPKTGAESVEVWSDSINCFESDEVLETQYFRTDDGERENEPQLCPLCRLTEYVRYLVESGEDVVRRAGASAGKASTLGMYDPIFYFPASDASKSVTVHAAPFYGGVNTFDMDDETAAEIKAAGLSPSRLYQESVMPKENYAFAVVDEAHLDQGVLITVETKSLGRAMQKAIDDRIEASGEHGDPFLHPYPFKWEFRPKAPPSEMYHAIALDPRAFPLSPDVARMIHARPPDMGNVTAWPNIHTLRATLEQHCLIELPWDDIFEPIMAYVDDNGVPRMPGDEDDPATEFPPEGEPERAPAPELGDTGAAMIACDQCKRMISVTATVCPHCGAQYADDDQPEQPAAPATPSPPIPPSPPQAPAALKPPKPTAQATKRRRSPFKK